MMRTVALALCIGLRSHVVPSRRRWLLPPALVPWSPTVAAIVLVAGVAERRWRAIRRRRREASLVVRELPLLGELVLMGLTAGLPFAAALHAAGEELSGPLRREVALVARRAADGGVRIALAGATGAAHRLYAVAARATSTGAPLGSAVEAWVDELRAEERERRLTAARKLPVKLAFPLALLILPGFVLLTVAPALVRAVERFGV